VTAAAIERTFRVMNTDALIVVHPTRAGAVRTAQRVAFAEKRAADIEQIFSRFIATSELCRINASGGSWFTPSTEMAAVLELAYRLHLDTGGVFDPAVLPDLERSGYDRSFADLPSARPAATTPRERQHAFAEAQRRDHDWRLPPGLRIDFGGIVKGWTADLLANELSTCGPALVELGGDTAVRGTPPGRGGWDVGVKAPSADALLAVVEVAEGGIATSGRDQRRWKMGAAWAHHLIDPRTGEPAHTDLMQVTAFAPSASLAEVWAKTSLIVGSNASEELMHSRSDLQLLLVPEHGTAVASSGVRFARGEPAAAAS
jgi:thiamine biosynthesis lipoprotein